MALKVLLMASEAGSVGTDTLLYMFNLSNLENVYVLPESRFVWPEGRPAREFGADKIASLARKSSRKALLDISGH